MSQYKCIFCERDFDELAHIFCIDLPTENNIGLTACAKGLGILCPNCIPNIVVKIHLLEEDKGNAENGEDQRELEPETKCGGAFVERERAEHTDVGILGQIARESAKPKDDRDSGEPEKDNLGGQADRIGEL